MKKPFITSLLCVSLLLPTLNVKAETLSAAEELQLELVTEQLSQEVTLEKLQHGMDVVREGATEEEKLILDSIQLELNHIAGQEEISPQKQTKAGKIASKVGLTVMRGYFNALRPFLYAAGYVRARVEKQNRFDDQTNSNVINFFAHLGNLLRNKGEIAAAKIAERIVSGDLVTSAEIEVLVTAVPKLDMSGAELAGAYGGQFIAINTVGSVISAAGLGAVVSPIVSAAIIGTLASSIPCAFSDIGKHPNQNLIQYCDQIAEDGYRTMMKSKIRGYLKGVQDRNMKN